MKTDQKTKIGTLGHNGRVFVEWLDPDTGERGKGWFGLDRLCELGYGDHHIPELVVLVRTVQL